MLNKPLLVNKSRALNRLRVLVWVYFIVVFAWAVSHPFLGDHPWWLFPVNALSFGFFALLPLVVLAAFLLRRRDIWLGTLAVFLLALSLYGRLFLPPALRTGQDVRPTGPSMIVMTYNVLGYNEHPQAVVDAILASGADVVALQELNPDVAHAIRQDLAAAYPYQQLDPHVEFFGLGVISRYPLRLSDERLPGDWVGTPQIVEISVDGQSITLLNAHAFASHPGPPAMIETVISVREENARTIRDFATAHPEPVIVVTDFNSTPQNTTYSIITGVLSDSWAEAGWGLGNTFPGGLSLSSGNFQLKIASVVVPTWLIRIDYVFHSQHFRATDARIGPWDGYSDHRPVVARLVFSNHYR